ncbi:hypothetical protein ABGB18_36900 [Nonomuraea sp. B12E4]|uniref:hypothetical protein n=1 Tax=Nonomuraea sp. B12E4 TaxID=3153564 RepID=UPI00325CDCA7
MLSLDSATAAADSTPRSLVTRSIASHATSGTLSDSGTSTVRAVATSSSKRPTIWLPAVAATPSVTTRVVMPSTVPSVVSAERTGRASMPASASPPRSRTCITSPPPARRR